MSELQLPLLRDLSSASRIKLIEDAIEVTADKYFSLKSAEDVRPNLDRVKEMMGTIEKYVEESISTTFDLPFRINAFALTGGGKYLVYGTTRGNITIFNTENKFTEVDVRISNDSIFSVIVTKDENYLLACGKGSTIRVYTYPSITYKLEMEGHTDNVMRLAQTKDGKTLFSISEDTTVRRWDLTTFTGGEVLYKHEGKIKSIVLSYDEKFLFTGGEEGIVRVYSFEAGKEVAQLPGHERMIWALAVTTNGKYLASGAIQIFLWDLETYKIIKKFEGHEKRVAVLQFSPDEEYLVSAATDTNIIIWPLYKRTPYRVLSGHTGWVKAMMISPDQKFIYSGAEDSTFRIWPFPRDIEDIQITTVDQNVSGLAYSHEGRNLLISNENKLALVNLNTGTIYQELQYDKLPEQTAIFSPRTNSVIVPLQNYVVSYNLLTGEETTSEPLHNDSISCLVLGTRSNLLVTGGKDAKVAIWEYPSFTEKLLLRGHRALITALAMTADETLVISADAEMKIRVWSIVNKSTLAILNDHKEEVTHIVLDKNRMMITADASGVIFIWDLKFYEIETTFSLDARVTGLYLTRSERELIACNSEGTFFFWDLVTRQLTASFSVGYPVSSFCLDSSEITIYYQSQDQILHMKNPLKATNFHIYGSGDKNVFIQYLSNIIIEKRPTAHMPEFDSWLIMPYRINVSHIFAYYGKVDLIKSYFEHDFNLLRSSDTETALSIGIYRGLSDISNIILDKLIYKLPSNKYLLGAIEDCIVLMNNEGNKFLPALYENFMRVVEDERLPKFCSANYEYPLIELTDGMRLDPELFIPKEIQSSEGELIMFKESLLKVNCHSGSKWSLEFLQSILDCPAQDIFRSEYIQALLQYKWQKLRYYMYTQAFVYFIYLILLSFLTIGEFQNGGLIAVAFVLNVILLLFEVFQMVVSGAQYWSDFWNYLDILRSTTFMMYLIFKIMGIAESWNYEILSVVTLTSWTRGIAYFRIFSKTRYITKLLVEVLKDMKAFLVILLYSTLSFSFLFFVLKSNSNDEKDEKKPAFIDYLETSYGLNLGEMQKENDLYEFIIVTIALIINPIVMLNLLISIIGDTFDRVQSEMVIADMKELCEMVIEIENSLYWRRNDGSKLYLQLCTTKQKEEIDVQWEGKLREIEKRMISLGQTITKIDQKNVERFDALDASVKTILDMLKKPQGDDPTVQS